MLKAGPDGKTWDTRRVAIYPLLRLMTYADPAAEGIKVITSMVQVEAEKPAFAMPFRVAYYGRTPMLRPN